MKPFLLALFALLSALPAFAQLDQNLLQQAERWKSGETPPPRLLKFPHGKIDEFPLCGMRVIGSEVSDYITQLKNPDLLAALLLDYRAQADTVHAAATQLITLKGTDHVARLLDSHSREATRSELAVLAQLLRSPYSAIQVARIASDDMELSAAERALQDMRADLEAGTSWADAYRKAADKHPDLKDRAKDPRSVRTLVCYLYDSVVSPTGFDILRYTIRADLPQQHLADVFRARARHSRPKDSRGRLSLPLQVQMKSPNHALQRTAPRDTARAFCERSGSYIWGACRSFHRWARAAPRSAVAELGVVRRCYALTESE